jgi:hypothetical protein
MGGAAVCTVAELARHHVTSTSPCGRNKLIIYFIQEITWKSVLGLSYNQNDQIHFPPIEKIHYLLRSRFPY